MMTSNRPLEDWGKLIGDVPSATAILDRFLHHAREVFPVICCRKAARKIGYLNAVRVLGIAGVNVHGIQHF